MDNMKDKFAQFSGISIMLVSASMTLFTRLVDGYYELKNVLSIIITLYICIILVKWFTFIVKIKTENRRIIWWIKSKNDPYSCLVGGGYWYSVATIKIR